MTQTPEETKGAFEELANVVLGTPKSKFLGGGRIEDGLVHKVEIMDQKVDDLGEAVKAMSQRGIKIRLSTPVWVALIGLLSAVIVAVIGLYSQVPGG